MRPRSRKCASWVAAAALSASLPHAGTAQEAVLRAPVTPPTEAREWSLRLPKQETVEFHGVVNFDDAGTKGGNVLYPAPNAIIGLAAVLAHGAVVGSMQESQKQELRTKADKVLAPYQPVLQSYTYRDLMRRGLEKATLNGQKQLVEFSAKSANWVIETAAVFSMTQDQRAIVLDNAIFIFAPKAEKVTSQTVIRVVSQPREEPDLVAYWSANEGEKLKEESAGLLAESLNIAIGEIGKDPGKEPENTKTVRYSEGKTLKMERGQVVKEECNRIVVRTLRGELLSVPPRRSPTSASADCGDARSGPK